MITVNGGPVTSRILAVDVFNAEREMPVHYSDVDDLIRSQDWIYREIGSRDLYDLGAGVWYESGSLLSTAVADKLMYGISVRILEDVAFVVVLSLRLELNPAESVSSLLDLHRSAWPVELDVQNLMDSGEFKCASEYWQYRATCRFKKSEPLEPEEWLQSLA